MPTTRIPGPLVRTLRTLADGFGESKPIGLDDDDWSSEPYCKPGKWIPIGSPSGPKGAMIVPETKDASLKGDDKALFDENKMWSGQWRQHDPNRRTVFTIPVNASLTDFETVVESAIAGSGGKDVILMTGHGSLATDSKTGTSFDTVPESGGMSTHKHRITQEVLDLDTIAVKDSGGKWVPKPPKGGGKDPAYNEKAKRIKRTAPYFDMLQRIGASMKSKGVDRFRLLTCSVGKDVAFVQKLAKVMGVKIVAYKLWTITWDRAWSITGCPNKGKFEVRAVQLWNGKKVPHTPPNIDKEGPAHPSFTTVPTNNEVRRSP